MRRLLLFCAILGSLNVLAQTDERTAKSGPHSVNALLSFPRGGISFGAGYEFMYQDSLGIEGHLRLFGRETAAGKSADGALILGGGPAYHFYKKSWDLTFKPTANVINIDPGVTGARSSTVFGPGLSVSLLCQITRNVALGFDLANYWVWFDRDYAGHRIDDLAMKIRLGF